MSAITGVHPYADKFPMLPEAELAELSDSIHENGLRQPVVVTPDGLILDGRNRAKACEMAGIEPTTVEYGGDDLAEYVIDCNVTRRNMSTGARAMATALVLDADGRRKDGKWDGAKGRGIIRGSSSTNSESSWVKAITQCGVVIDWASDVVEQVASGALPLDRAYELAKERRDAVDAEHRAKAIEAQRKREATIREKEANDRMLGTLTKERSKYLEQVESGGMSIKAAHAAHLADTEKQRKRQREIEMGWRDTCTHIAEAIFKLQDGADYGAIFLREFYPHEADFVPQPLRLTRSRIQGAIDFLTTIQKGVTK
ncbi:hypothetical protein GCM10009785_13930 [Brooklawnia cerclae]|uniref:ParB-like N-terminal domain-containing protein n=1 Tax=Brooklawnia cerclae TaxID=349934 RepID=A0ABX0SI03_9ACTN|nr:ParB N-terminal domain-containing protein [Brooklawnia cerclae]NIH58037.1 hypothetical protein [Brooklawnia cerclae]